MNTDDKTGDPRVDAAKAFVDSLGLRSADILRKMLENEHRTIQQCFMRCCVAFIEDMAQQRYSDDRNRAAVEFAKAVVARTTPRERAMPFI